ncbi:MAG: rane-associated protein [Patescibacteria group bacterium]|nr:rane-associated protein [Patescibacteria group bacterium]
MFDVIQILQDYGYIGMFLISFLESGVFPILPGDSLLFASGILASNNYINIYVSIAVFFTGSFLGGISGYYIGDKLEDLRDSKYFSFYLKKVFKEKYLDEAREFFKRRGELTILLCKFVPIVRTFAPVIAGVVEMDYKKFVLYNLLGAFVWSVSFVGLGYFLGERFPFVSKYMEYIIIAILIVTTAPVIVKVYKKYKNRKSN